MRRWAGGERFLLSAVKVRLALEPVGGLSLSFHVPRYRDPLFALVFDTFQRYSECNRRVPHLQGKIRPWILPYTVATCVLSATTIRFLRCPGLMLSKLKCRRSGPEHGPWVVADAREACKELECEEEEGVGGNEMFSPLCAV